MRALTFVLTSVSFGPMLVLMLLWIAERAG